jgi:hypothetical protein
MDLTDGDRVVGWITGHRIGFRGFIDETEATHAAWVAHQTLARRIARTHGMRLIPVDAEPLTLGRSDDGKNDIILASNRPIATLFSPGSHSRVSDSFAFELTAPSRMSELELRGVAYLIYRTVRKSGIGWALWRSATPTPTRTSKADSGTTVRVREPVKRPRRRTWTLARGALRRVGNRLRLTPGSNRGISPWDLTVYK